MDASTNYYCNTTTQLLLPRTPDLFSFVLSLLRLLFLLSLLLVSPTYGYRHNYYYHDHKTRPNIVFIMADDLGYNDVGYHNRKGTYTPTIDKLAREGIRLENYYVQPICSPTRGQFLSGRSQIHTGLQHKNLMKNQPNGLPLDSPTLPDKLKEAGYATDMVGKWHLGYYKNEYLPTSRGFETFYGMYLGTATYFGHRNCLTRRCLVDLHNDTRFEQRPDLRQDGVYSTHLFTDEAVRIINHRSRQDNPFFLYLSYQAVHGPVQVPEKYRRLISKRLKFKHVKTALRQHYVAMIYAMDQGIKRVVTSLKRNGVWNNTILVFSTDNGGTRRIGGSNLPLKGQKGSFDEGGVRAIGLVNSPLFQKTGYINNGLMHITDWFPTFVSLANGKMNGTRDVNGFNQWISLNYGLPSPRDEILFNIDPLIKRSLRNYYSHTSFDVRIRAALRKGDYKIITGNRKPPGFSLYNIKKDPLELYNLARLKTYQHRVDYLLDILHAHQKTAVPARFPRLVRFPEMGGVWGPWKGRY